MSTETSDEPSLGIVMDALIYTRELSISRDELWKCFTTAEGLCRWLCLRANVELEVGGAYELFWNPDPRQMHSDSTIGCCVIGVEAPRLLEFTWRGSDAVADVMNVEGAPVTQVRVELTPTLDGTRLTLSHFGWADGVGWERARDWFDRAWQGALQRLVAALPS